MSTWWAPRSSKPLSVSDPYRGWFDSFPLRQSLGGDRLIGQGRVDSPTYPSNKGGISLHCPEFQGIRALSENTT